MERRDLLKMIAAATGTALVSRNVLAWDPTRASALKDTGYTSDDLGLINEIADTIIPRTDTPGAKDVNVAATMAIIVVDCFTLEEQTLFNQGLQDIQQLAQKSHGKGFVQLTSQQRLDLLTPIDAKATSINKKRWQDKKLKAHPFTLIKQLVLFTFFTSKVGAMEVLRFVAVPGRYDGHFPYKKGDKAWAT